jgi:multiple sugar transport system substrate-binding protein
MTIPHRTFSHSRRTFLKGTAAGLAGAATWAGYLRDTSVIAAQASGEVRLSGPTSSPAEEELLRQVLDTFAGQFPDITVNYQPVAADYYIKLQTDIAAGNAADVFYVKNEFSQDFMSRDVLLAIDDYMAADGVNPDDFYASLLNAFKWEGKTYGLPKDWSPLGMVYDPAALEDAGVEVPATWDDLRSAAQAITDASGQAAINLAPALDRFILFLYQAGGNVTDESFSQVTLDQDPAKQALDFYYGLYTDGLSATPADVGAQWPGDAFAQGLASIIFEGNWMFPFLKDNAPDKEYGIAELPAGPGGKGTPAFTNSYSIFKGSKNPEAAWTLVNYLTGPEGMATWTSLGLAMPARPGLSEDWLAQYPDRKPYLDSGEYATAVQYGPGGQKFNDDANAVLQSLFAGQIDTTEAQTQLTDAANNDLTLGAGGATPEGSPEASPVS